MQQGCPATASCPSFETVGVTDWRGVWFGKGQNGGSPLSLMVTMWSIYIARLPKYHDFISAPCWLLLLLSLNHSPLLPLFNAELLFLRGRTIMAPDHPQSRKDHRRQDLMKSSQFGSLPQYDWHAGKASGSAGDFTRPSEEPGGQQEEVEESGQGCSGGWPTGQWGDMVSHRRDTHTPSCKHACTHMHMRMYVRMYTWASMHKLTFL